MTSFGKIIVLTFTTMAAFLDLKEEKIPNTCMILGWLAGFFWNLHPENQSGVLTWLTGSLIPLLFFSPLFYFRMIGAGDIKLLSVLGGFMGPSSILHCIFFSLIFGAILAAALLCLCNNFKDRFHHFITYFQLYFQQKQRTPYRLSGRNRAEHLHFSVAVLMGVLLWTGGIY